MTPPRTTPPSIIGALVLACSLAVAAPALAAIEMTTSFTNDPVLPGATATLEYTIYNTFSGTVTDLTFLHTVQGIPSSLATTSGDTQNVCGSGSSFQISGIPSGFFFSLGELAGGASCTFSINIHLNPAIPTGTYVSNILGFSGKLLPSGVTVTGNALADSLRVTSLALNRDFLLYPILPGKPVPVRYTITNGYPEGAIGLGFTEDFNAVIAGMRATGLPQVDVCGIGSLLTDATGPLQLIGGNVPDGTACTFMVDVEIPEGTAPGDYSFESSALTGFLSPSGTPISEPPASETLLLHPVAGDWDGDGMPDMVWRNAARGLGVLAYFDNAALTGLDPLPKAPAPWEIVAADDFNKDGRMDLIWSNSESGMNIASFFKGAEFLGLGTLPPVPAPWVICGSGDLSGDGRADLMLFNADTGQVAALFLDGVTRIGAKLVTALPSPWQPAGFGDLDSDGHVDLLARHPVSGAVAVGYLMGTALQNIALLPAAPPPWRITGFLDQDQDGMTDILLHNPDTGENEAWYMDNATRLGIGTLPKAPPAWKGISGRR